MSIVSSALRTLERGRKLIEKAGLRTSSVYIRRAHWDGGEALLGALSTSDIQIKPNPEVIERGGGRIDITGITPSYAGGGWAPGILDPTELVGDDIYLVIVGPSGKLNPYRATAYDGRNAFTYTIRAEQLDRAKPTEGW